MQKSLETVSARKIIHHILLFETQFSLNFCMFFQSRIKMKVEGTWHFWRGRDKTIFPLSEYDIFFVQGITTATKNKGILKHTAIKKGFCWWVGSTEICSRANPPFTNIPALLVLSHFAFDEYLIFFLNNLVVRVRLKMMGEIFISERDYKIVKNRDLMDEFK